VQNKLYAIENVHINYINFGIKFLTAIQGNTNAPNALRFEN